MEYLVPIASYLGIALAAAAADASLCYAVRRRYRARVSIICALAWPITLPLVIAAAIFMTQDFPPRRRG